MLVELRVAEQRYRAVREVLDGRLGDRGGPPVRGVAAECARLVEPVCRRGWSGWFG